MTVVGVKYGAKGKIFNCESTEPLEKGTKVVVETDKGEYLAIVENEKVATSGSAEKRDKIVRQANKKDYDRYLSNLKYAQSAYKETKELVKRKNINMKIVDASYSLDRKLLLFNFIATKFHTRIELHQIGVRDKAKEIGGLGMCGRTLCCSSCLKNISAVNINMVKNQNIALNPTKINGACGRLLCCFTYENENYETNRKKLPKIGENVKYNNKNGVVCDIDVLNCRYTLKFDNDTYEEVSIDD